MKKVVVSNGREHANFNVDVVEARYNAKFVGQLCLKTVNGMWGENVADVYYVQNPDTSLGHSHYFALFGRGESVYITRGDSAVEPIISAVVANDGEIIYSAYRHDYRISKDNSVFIDGGRDYTRAGRNTIGLKVVDGEWYELEEEDYVFLKLRGDLDN